MTSTPLTSGSVTKSTLEKSYPVRRQNTLSEYIVRPASVTRQKCLNQILLKMLVKDMQPFSIVSDEGFREFVAALDPSYSLPDRMTLTVLPGMYSDAVDKVKAELSEAESITLTTDGWTSMTTDGYIAVTAHYIQCESKKIPPEIF